MALKLRLARHGAKKRPYYRIVIADSRSPRDGRFIDRVGSYNPMLPKDSEDRVKLDVEKVKEWLAKGARPTDRVGRFLSEAGLFEWKPSNNPNKGKPGEKALQRIEDKKERAEARKIAEAEAKEAAKEAAKAAEEAAKAAEAEAKAAAAAAPAVEEAPAAEEAPVTEEAPAAEAAPAAEEAAAPEAPAAEEAAKAHTKSSLTKMLEVDVVKLANEMGIEATVDDLKNDTIEKILAAQG